MSSVAVLYGKSENKISEICKKFVKTPVYNIKTNSIVKFEFISPGKHRLVEIKDTYPILKYVFLLALSICKIR